MLLYLILCHILVILALLALTLARRVFLAMIMNFGYLSILLIGLVIFARLNIRYGLFFLVALTFNIVASLTIMFIEAFALYVPSDDRAFVFYVNIPIVIDIAFDVAYFVIYFKDLRPLAK